jgi:hypothetical protein
MLSNASKKAKHTPDRLEPKPQRALKEKNGLKKAETIL